MSKRFGSFRRILREKKEAPLQAETIPIQYSLSFAGVAQLVERYVANVAVAGSSPVTRSWESEAPFFGASVFSGRVEGPFRVPLQSEGRVQSEGRGASLGRVFVQKKYGSLSVVSYRWKGVVVSALRCEWKMGFHRARFFRTTRRRRVIAAVSWRGFRTPQDRSQFYDLRPRGWAFSYTFRRFAVERCV